MGQRFWSVCSGSPRLYLLDSSWTPVYPDHGLVVRFFSPPRTRSLQTQNHCSSCPWSPSPPGLSGPPQKQQVLQRSSCSLRGQSQLVQVSFQRASLIGWIETRQAAPQPMISARSLEGLTRTAQSHTDSRVHHSPVQSLPWTLPALSVRGLVFFSLWPALISASRWSMMQPWSWLDTSFLTGGQTHLCLTETFDLDLLTVGMCVS